MSRVTNVMVSHSILEEEAKRQLAQPLASDSLGQALRNITDVGVADGWGGTKAPEVDVWAAAFNYVSPDQVLAHVASVQWTEPEFVQVFIQDQDDSKFTVYEFHGGELLPLVSHDG